MTTPAIRTERFVKSDHAKFLQKTENPVKSFGDHERVSPKEESVDLQPCLGVSRSENAGINQLPHGTTGRVRGHDGVACKPPNKVVILREALRRSVA